MSLSESVDYSWNSTAVDEGNSVTRNVIVGIIYGTITLITIAGNLMVIVAFATDVRINRKLANWYIVNLSVADVTVGLVTLTVSLIWLITEDWPFGEIPCKIFLVVDYVIANVSSFTIIAISLDRYWLVTKKLDYPKYQTKRTATALITFIWTFSVVFFGVLTFAWIPITGYEEKIDYSWNCELEATYNFGFQLFMFALFFVFPLVTIAVLNVIVYRNIRQRSKGFVQSKPVASSKWTQSDISASTSSKDQETREEAHQLEDGIVNKAFNESDVSVSSISLSVRNRETDSTKARKPPVDKTRKEFIRHRKAAITLAVLVSVFIICWLPFYVTVLLGTLCESCVHWKVWEVTTNLLWCNSTINRFLYAAMNVHFKENFMNFLGFGKMCRK